MSTSIFQIYFKEELKEHLDPDFVPMDNTDNPHPELREWDKWNREHDNIKKQGLDYWGFVSWKFQEKTGLSGRQVLDFIEANPGRDVYLFNPCILNEAVFANSWEQGDMYHPNISDIGNNFLRKIGYKDVSVKETLLDRNKTVFANYIVGSSKFWENFMEFSRKLFSEADLDQKFKEDVFGAGKSNYAHDASLPNFTFLIERLIPTYLELESIDSLGYTYTHDTVPDKYTSIFDEIMALSNLKLAINEHESDDLYEIWNYYRRAILHRNPGILAIE
jgi:hypothetical protein